jgi:hypothetical protein
VALVEGVRRRRQAVGHAVDYLVEHGAKIDVAERGGLTPVDAALGKAGGHGRGSTIEVYEATAARLRELCEQQEDCDLSRPKGPS